MIEQKLCELGLELPVLTPPRGSYAPWMISNGYCHISGQLPPVGSPEVPSPYLGIVGADVSIITAQAAARQCGLMILAQLNAAIGGDFDRFARVVRLGGFVRSTRDFSAQPQVINGASDLMIDVFGDAGRHVRTAVGVASLPFNICVEVDAVIELTN